MKKKNPPSAMRWEKAADIQRQISELISKLQLIHINPHYIISLRSYGSKARARARIWSFPRVWQLALNLPPHYVIEVLSERFDHLNPDDQTRVLIHELMHIPKTFSGALTPHSSRFHRINHRTVEQLFKLYTKK